MWVTKYGGAYRASRLPGMKPKGGMFWILYKEQGAVVLVLRQDEGKLTDGFRSDIQ